MASLSVPTTSQYRDSYQYRVFPCYPDKSGQVIQPLSTSTAKSECMIIVSYGDYYYPNVAKRVRRGSFLKEVSQDLRLVQAMIKKDPHTSLGGVLPDVPGANYTRDEVISEIEEFLKNCQEPGAVIWYSGHGEIGTGNWAFKDKFISLDDIMYLYLQHFRGRLLTIVSDCCYSGQWVHQLADVLNDRNIGACGHQAASAGLALKINTSCGPNETALDGIYAKEGVRVVPELNNWIELPTEALEDKSIGHSQIPMSIDTTHITCFNPGNCGLNLIPQRAMWSWKDLMSGDDRKDRLRRRLVESWKQQWPNQLVTGSIVMIDDDKLETLEENARTHPFSVVPEYYGWTLYCGMMPPPDVFIHFGPI